MSQVFALFIGIDQYKVIPLRGCVNDAIMIETYLQETLGNRLQAERLHNADATKPNIVDMMLGHLGQATPADHVFLHYAGHGDRQPAPEPFWHLTVDRQNEVLVTVDSLYPQTGLTNPLTDKELRWLIAQIAKKTPNITLVLDCCHSGTGTRETLPVDLRIRSSKTDSKQVRSLDSYVFMQQDPVVQKAVEQKQRFDLPSGKHLLLAACRNSETAKELKIGEQQGGIFTYSLVQTLQQYKGNISYADLVRLAGAQVINKVREQTPQLEAIALANPHGQFLGGQTAQPRYYIITQKNNEWVIDKGAIHGIVTDNSAPTQLAIYDTKDDIARQSPIAEGYIAKVAPAESTIIIKGNPDKEAYKAVITQMPVPQASLLRLYFRTELPDDCEENGIDLLRFQLNKKDLGQAVSPKKYLSEVNKRALADYCVTSYEHEGKNKYRITPINSEVPLVAQTIGFTEESAENLIQQLVHIAKFTQLYRLANPQSNINLSDVEIEVRASNRNAQTGQFSAFEKIMLNSPEIQVPFYTFDAGNGQFPASSEYQITVKNHSARGLWCSLYYMGSDFQVTNEVLKKTFLPPGGKIEAIEGNAFAPDIPQELLRMGVTQDRATFKLIASTEEFDADYFNLSALQRAQSLRGFITSSRTTPINADWLTNQVNFTIIKTDELNSQKALQQHGIAINSPKNGFAAIFSLLSSLFKKRDLADTGADIPDILRNNPQIAQSIAVLPSERSVAEPLDTLELSEVKNPAAITPQNPLEITLPITTKKGETLIAIASDGELFYPVGVSTATTDKDTVVSITSLPTQQEATSERGLKTTIKLVFQKILHENIGTSYMYPRLAAVKITRNKISYVDTPESIAEQVRLARRVAVVVHGFTGETRDFFMLNDKKAGKLYTTLTKYYDLILAFDYETLNTPIVTTATDMKNRLAAVGLGKGHEKKLHIIAHSLGGIVSRYYIEKLGGDVQNLVMLGVPNGGTPIVKMLDIANYGLSLLLNNLQPKGWQTNLVAIFSRLIESGAQLNKVTSDLAPNSSLLQQLNNNPSFSAANYTVIAGNTADLLEARKAIAPRSLLEKILHKISPEPIAYKLFTQFLFHENNDMAVTLGSMGLVDVQGQSRFRVISIPCNHCTYFTSNEGIGALDNALRSL